LKIKYRYNWVRGWVQVDGFKWYIRGTDFNMRHEEWLRKEVDLSGDLFVDVGAHVGTWTIRAAKGFRRVMAFEPDPKWYRMLRRNLEANSFQNVETFNLAASSTSGNGMRTIDSYHVDPTLIKIDAEGAECKVLEGCAETMGRSHPQLVVETHTRELADTAKKMLHVYNYEIREIVKVNRWGNPQSFLICHSGQEVSHDAVEDVETTVPKLA
jgi:precorrin-6B methylase 2